MTRHLVDLTGRPPSWPSASRRLWEDCLRRVGPQAWSSPPPPTGHPALRRALAAELGADADDIVITAGVRAAALLLARSHGAVLVERPTFRGVLDVFGGLGPPPHTAVWGERFLAEADRLGARADRGLLCWVTSPFRNPDGRSLDETFAAGLAALAADHTVVVNEVYRWSTRSPAAGDGYHVGSLSKVAGGGVRLGWIRGAGAVDAVGGLSSLWTHPPMPWQEAWALFIEREGLSALREVYCEQPASAARAFVAALPAALRPSDAVPGSPHLTLPLRASDEAAAEAELRRRGLAMGRGRDFCTSRPALRLSFASVTIDQAELAARIYAEFAGVGVPS
jgi:DNA-binding transcriptional MocR family regulator